MCLGMNVIGLAAAGLYIHPGVELSPQRMACTLAALGPRPMIELHAAGLKVGELAARARLAGRSLAELAEITLRGHLLGTRIA